jgi:hypothetical protein
LTNFPNGKQTQESLESGFPESEFRETNMALNQDEESKNHTFLATPPKKQERKRKKSLNLL